MLFPLRNDSSAAPHSVQSSEVQILVGGSILFGHLVGDSKTPYMYLREVLIHDIIDLSAAGPTLWEPLLGQATFGQAESAYTVKYLYQISPAVIESEFSHRLC
jgi:hypothetical protein